jgi:hypothetical protein
LVLRAYTNLWDWDFALQGGKNYGGYHVGGGFTGEVWVLGIRGEAGYFFVEPERTVAMFDPAVANLIRTDALIENHFNAVIGVDRRFDNSLHLALEYFYNGTADTDSFELSLARVAIGESFSVSEHQAGALVSYELHPLLLGQLTYIFSFSDYSSLIGPSLSYSIADEAEFLAGALVAIGKRPRTRQTALGFPYPALRSEFGTYPNVFFGEVKFYF